MSTNEPAAVPSARPARYPSRRDPVPAELLAALADRDRATVFAWLLRDGPVPVATAVDTAVRALRIAPRTAGRAIAKLTGAGLLLRINDELVVDLAPLRTASEALADTPVARRLGSVPRLAGRLSHGRLTDIPVDRAAQRDLADALRDLFTPGRPYPEAEVNALLRDVHGDVAALRRLLVDEGVLRRDRDLVYQR